MKSIKKKMSSLGEVKRVKWKHMHCFPCGSADKESACNVGDLGSISGLGRSPGEGKGYPPQYYGLENSTGCIVHGVTKSRTQLSNLKNHRIHRHHQM